MEERTVGGDIEVGAPPEVMYRLISDVPNLPGWAAECVQCTWILGLPLAEWCYDITPLPRGYRAVESTRTTAVVHKLIGPVATGVRRRDQRHRGNIVRTLERLEATAAAERRGTLAPG